MQLSKEPDDGQEVEQQDPSNRVEQKAEEQLLQQQEQQEEDEYGWDDIGKMTPDQIKEELVEQRKRFEAMERDLFKAQTAARKLSAQVKQLGELNAQHGVTHNNTSSAFTLPSEFKKLWDELVTELILDAFPDFLEQYKPFCCLVQELFIVVRQLILDTKHKMVVKMATELRLIPEGADSNSEQTKQVIGMLSTKLQSVFKDYSTQVFSFSTEQIKQFIETEYKPRCESILSDDDDAADMFEDNVGTPDFIRFVQAIVKLQLHMVLNDPPIELSMLSCKERDQKTELVEKFEFWMFNKNDYYCIDGFPREGYPCVVVLPPPYRQGYVYQGIKPAVIVLSDANQDDMLMDHVHAKQQAVIEKLKQKRASSLATVKESTATNSVDAKAPAASTSSTTGTSMINIKKIEVPKAPTPAKQQQNNSKEEVFEKASTPEDQKNDEESIKEYKEVMSEGKQDDKSSATQNGDQPNDLNAPKEDQTENEITVKEQEKVPPSESCNELSSDAIVLENNGEKTNKAEKQEVAAVDQNDDDETDIRESGPLESNDPKSSTGKLETSAASMSSRLTMQRNIVPEPSQPEMMELPLEVIKSSRTKVVEVNLPPRAAHTLNSGRLNTTQTSNLNNQNTQNRTELLRSPSPQFQSRRMDRKIGESEEEDQQLPQTTQQSCTEPAPAPSPSATVVVNSASPIKHSSQHQQICDEGSRIYSQSAESKKSSTSTRKQLQDDFSQSSRAYTIESQQEGAVQEFAAHHHNNGQQQYNNNAHSHESYKGSRVGANWNDHLDDGSSSDIAVSQSSPFEKQQNRQPLTQCLTADQDDLGPVSKRNSNHSNLYDMPKMMHELVGDDDEDNIENVNSSANKKQYQKMFSPSSNHNNVPSSNSPYFQSSKFSLQAARNQVNASTSSISNVYKRDRSSSNNASKRPPIMPTSSSIVSTSQHQSNHNMVTNHNMSSLSAMSGNSPHNSHHYDQNQIINLNGIQVNQTPHLMKANNMLHPPQNQHSQTLEAQQKTAATLTMKNQNGNNLIGNNAQFTPCGAGQMTISPGQNNNGGSSSIIAEMHYQKGMTDYKQDLQRKIVTYQSILKKTYAQAEKEKQQKKMLTNTSMAAASKTKGSRDGSKGSGTPVAGASNNNIMTIQSNTSKRQPLVKQNSANNAASLEQRCQPSKLTATLSSHAQGKIGGSVASTIQANKTTKQGGARAASKEKVESLDQLKSAYFAKLQSLSKKLDNERVVGGSSNASNHRREDSQSRSKSPMQPWKNMPRQMPPSMKDVYIPAAACIPVNRKSLSRGKGSNNGSQTNPSIGNNKQISIKQGMKTTMTSNSGQFFQNTKQAQVNSSAPGKHTVTARQPSRIGASFTMNQQRNSCYNNSSDSSDDIVRGGDMRRGSAPTMEHNHQVVQQQNAVTGHRRRQQQAQVAYVNTSSDSDQDDSSDSDSDDSIERAGVYQPSNHLRKAVNATHGNKTVIARSTKQNVQYGARPQQTRNKSIGKQRDSSATNTRRKSSNTRAKHGIQSIQNRTALAGGFTSTGDRSSGGKQLLTGKQSNSTTARDAINHTLVQHHGGYQGNTMNFFNTSGDHHTTAKQGGQNSLTHHQAQQNNNYVSHQQKSQKQVSINNRTAIHQGPAAKSNSVSGASKHHIDTHAMQQPQPQQTRNYLNHQHNNGTTSSHQLNFHPGAGGASNFGQQHRSQGTLIQPGQPGQPASVQHQQMHHTLIQQQNQQQLPQGGFQPIYNLRSQAQMNLLDNHRLTESNLSNTSAYERVVNPVNDHHNNNQHHHLINQGQSNRRSGGNAVVGNSSGSHGGGYQDARNRHMNQAAMVNNYV